MKLIKIISGDREFFFDKDLIEWKDGLKTKTNFNVSSYIINNTYVAISKDKITFICDCGKEETILLSNFKNKKHDLCTSCTRKKTVTEVHKNMNDNKRKELNHKISIKTKEAMNNISPEKRQEMTNKMIASIDWDKRNKKWIDTMSNKTKEERLIINNKISISLNKRLSEFGFWNIKNCVHTTKNKIIPENKWFIRGIHSSNEIISCECNDCKNTFQSRRANFAKQEQKHPGFIYCEKCKLNGKRNPGYIDGRKYNNDDSYTALFYNNDYRIKIIENQNNICPICSDELDFSAHLHHIDYNKKNDNQDNLIFLHPSCHMKTNYDREFWLVFFKNYNKSYYDKLFIPPEFVIKYFNLFPLINHKFSKQFIIDKLKNRKLFDSLTPPNTKGHNISKMLSKKYFYSRKRKRNTSIVENISSNKISEIYKYGDSLSTIVNTITSSLYSFPVSLFSHNIMDWILTKWSNPGDIIYDPAGGFGGRLIGTFYHNVKYITTDPFTYDDLENINNLLDLNAIIYNKKSENLIMNCDMVVCCPPYYNDENYEYIEERPYNIWLKEYWQTTINNINCKKFVLIIGEKYKEIIDIVANKWNEKERFIIKNKSFKSINKEYIIYFES